MLGGLLNTSLIYAVIIINIVISFLVFLREKKDVVNITFAAFVWFLTFWSISVLMLFKTRTFFWGKTTLALVATMPASFFLFSRHFPRGERKVLENGAEWFLILVLPCVFLALSVTNLVLRNQTFFEGVLQPQFGPLYIPFIIFSMGLFTIGLLQLLFKYKTFGGVAKMQLRYMFFGFLMFVVGASLTNAVLPALGIYSLTGMGPFMSIFLVGFSAYAIVRHRFLDIRLLLGKGAIGSLSVLVIISPVILLGDRFTTITKTYLGINSDVSLVLLVLFLALLYPTIKNYVEKKLGAYLLSEEITMEEFLRKSHTIVFSQLDLEQMFRRLSELVEDSFKTKRFALVLFDLSSKDIRKIYRSFGCPGLKGKGYVSERLISVLENRSHPFSFHELKGKSLKLGLDVASPLFDREKLIGFLALGKKETEEIYTQEELSVLEQFSYQISLAIQNYRLFEEVQSFNKTLQEKVALATADLRRAYRQLKELDQVKDEFISIASHELRTPMTAIKGHLWMLKEGRGGKLTKMQAEYVQNAFEGTERMIRLISDMLDVSRIEQRAMHLDKKNIDVCNLIKEVIEELSVRAREAGVALNGPKAARKAIMVRADWDKMNEIFVNLISNSLKYTPRGGKVEVLVAVKRESVEFCVADTGVGIKRKDRPKLFKKFGRLSSSLTKAAEAGGTGLGLYISKSLVQAHGGRIWVEDNKGGGSRFCFTLPYGKYKKRTGKGD